ncbi:MAG: queuosine precursor transporter [Bacteroidetes bacterium]|jgi:uncharacterized integral membrane protein (TIGR00697 family)|nr:queuosine precursor transporter [Bacteroidota bacterium]
MFAKDSNSLNAIERRREIFFLVFSGLFIGSLSMLNILGITKLINLSFSIGNLEIPFKVFIGVIPYPITFLCTDFISEFYGKRRAKNVVWVGFLLNMWVLFILWVGGELPPVPELGADGLPAPDHPNRAFYEVRKLAFGATAASMLAYLTAQFVDVHVFHFLRKKTKGKRLWIRNNGSTLTSQLVDSLAVVFITYYFTHAIIVPDDISVTKYLLILILSNYFFKMFAAMVDTIPFYFGVKWLGKYLQIDIYEEFKKP